MKIRFLLITFFFISSVFGFQELVDKNRFTQLLTNHLLFDHFDKAYIQLARKISFQFRDVIHIRVKRINKTYNSTSIEPPVDVQILKRQIKGAVGSFVEDKLPSILTIRHNTASLQYQIDHLLNQHCPIISYQCLLDHRIPILNQVHDVTTKELEKMLVLVNERDLPRLFEKTRAQIAGILTHFNQHTMNENYHRLELKINHKQKASINNRNWITLDMIQEFISIANHTDEDEMNNLQHFVNLSV